MTYIEQLQTREWKKKRSEILLRDKQKCQRCENKKFLEKFEKGIFTSYSFPRNKEVINIIGLEEEIYLRANIDKKYSKYLNENTIIYSKENVNFGREVVGFRNSIEAENQIIKELNAKNLKINTFFLENNDENYLNETLEMLKNEISSKLKIYENNTKVNWIFKGGLHIHHKYYINGKKAWEYNNEALITLCYSCHEELHKNETIAIYNNEFELIGNYKYCLRCHGAGILPEYSHVKSGICFRCNGMRYEELITTANIISENC